MSEYKEVTETVDVPTDAGIAGFFVALRKILKMPRVVNVNIDSKGKVTFTRFARSGEPRKTFEVDFDAVTPGALVRNLELQELDVEGLENPSTCILSMFSVAASEHMKPIGFVAGSNTVLMDWHLKTTGVRIPSDSLCGLPLYRDRFIPDEALLLVTAYSADASLEDARKCYKIAMPGRQVPLRVVPELITNSHVGALEAPPVVAAATPTDEEVRDEVEVL